MHRRRNLFPASSLFASLFMLGLFATRGLTMFGVLASLAIGLFSGWIAIYAEARLLEMQEREAHELENDENL